VSQAHSVYLKHKSYNQSHNKQQTDIKLVLVLSTEYIQLTEKERAVNGTKHTKLKPNINSGQGSRAPVAGGRRKALILAGAELVWHISASHVGAILNGDVRGSEI
jgi:hypothetical protein